MGVQKIEEMGCGRLQRVAGRGEKGMETWGGETVVFERQVIVVGDMGEGC